MNTHWMTAAPMEARPRLRGGIPGELRQRAYLAGMEQGLERKNGWTPARHGPSCPPADIAGAQSGLGGPTGEDPHDDEQGCGNQQHTWQEDWGTADQDSVHPPANRGDEREKPARQGDG